MVTGVQLSENLINHLDPEKLTDYIILESKMTPMQIMHKFVISGKSSYDWTDKNDIIDFCLH